MNPLNLRQLRIIAEHIVSFHASACLLAGLPKEQTKADLGLMLKEIGVTESLTFGELKESQIAALATLVAHSALAILEDKT